MYGLFESNHIYRKIILSSVNDRVIAAYNEYKKKKKKWNHVQGKQHDNVWQCLINTI